MSDERWASTNGVQVQSTVLSVTALNAVVRMKAVAELGVAACAMRNSAPRFSVARFNARLGVRVAGTVASLSVRPFRAR